MKKLFAIAAIAVALTLAGCSAAPAGNDAAVKSAETSSSAPVASKTSEAPAPVLTAKPSSVDETLLTATRRIPGLENVSMADALKTSRYVCDQLDAGVSPLKISVVKSADPLNNEDMIMVSTLTICTGHNDAVQAAFVAERAKRNAAQG